ncbi:MAG: (d)CMP kinase [Gemmatimonadota bacterium]
MKPIIVAIDGPAASGKSTSARAVAERLGYCHLNSGLLYRAITWAALRGGWIDDEARFAAELERLDLSVEIGSPEMRVTVGGEEPGAELASPEVTERVSEVAARPEVRRRAGGILRSAGSGGGVVCDGRDIGTVVFPSAELKVYLTAQAGERGRRRLLQRGQTATRDAVAAEAARLRARDDADSSRAHSPLRQAEDAVLIDTTASTPEEVVVRIVELARERARSTVDDPDPSP